LFRNTWASPITVALTPACSSRSTCSTRRSCPSPGSRWRPASGRAALNDAFLRTYRRTPSELRRQRRGGASSPADDEVVLRLAFRPPYDWAHTAAFLAARAAPGVERMDGRGYARTLASEAGHALILVRPRERDHALELRVRGAAPGELFHVAAAARRCFDLSADPERIALTLDGDSLLGPLVRQRPGLRIPGAWDPFERRQIRPAGQRGGWRR
jgi:AraC family transcriptional regulator of adaptative response / DNA-3-methyladenine glycosylase II